jgi:putative nucleotidyltransferase with HDIG domain
LSSVSVENLEEGLILSEDVIDTFGRLIHTKGRRIEANHIRLFKIWGISEVQVQGAPVAVLPEQDSKDLEKLHNAEQTVKMILQNMDVAHPAINEIFAAAVEHRYQNNLVMEWEHRQQLPESFKLDLSNGVKTQIDFSKIQLPEAPGLVLEFNRVIQDPDCSINDVAEVLTRSPSMTAQLLRIVNSAFYGFASKIDRITRAVTLIGIREISSLVMGISAMRLFYDIPRELIDMSSFLRHSLACGILSRILAAQKKLPDTERLFVAGLLHDIGRLILYKYFPAQARLTMLMAKKTGLSLYDIEETCLGINHVQIAEHLLSKWQFPASLENIIAYHHAPYRSPEQAEASIVHLADIAINALGLGHSGEHIVPRFEKNIWDKTGIKPGDLRTALAQTTEQLTVMMKLFSELTP